jgi:hypothetical protein
MGTLFLFIGIMLLAVALLAALGAIPIPAQYPAIAGGAFMLIYFIVNGTSFLATAVDNVTDDFLESLNLTEIFKSILPWNWGN